MEETENKSSIQEVVPPSVDIQQESQPVQEEQIAVQSDDTDWIKNLRRDRKEAIRRAEESENRAKLQEELLQRIIAQQGINPQQIVQHEEDLIQELSKQQYVEGEKVAKALKQQQDQFKRELEEVKKSYASQKQNSLINDLRREYADFDEVVNPETIAILEETNPRLANAIASSKDPYNIAVQSYEYIKAKGLNSKRQGSTKISEAEKKIEQNKKIVQSPQVFEKRPIAQAFRMSDDMKKELQQEMYQYAQQAGMGY